VFLWKRLCPRARYHTSIRVFFSPVVGLQKARDFHLSLLHEVSPGASGRLPLSRSSIVIRYLPRGRPLSAQRGFRTRFYFSDSFHLTREGRCRRISLWVSFPPLAFFKKKFEPLPFSHKRMSMHVDTWPYLSFPLFCKSWGCYLSPFFVIHDAFPPDKKRVPPHSRSSFIVIPLLFPPFPEERSPLLQGSFSPFLVKTFSRRMFSFLSSSSSLPFSFWPRSIVLGFFSPRRIDPFFRDSQSPNPFEAGGR